MHKKGVSPLIASVLMIVVVVGIGAVVTGIVRTYVTENKQIIEKTSTDVDCSTGVIINVPKDTNRFWICANTATGDVNFTLENIGSLPIDELQVKVLGTAGVYANDSIMSSELAQGQTRALNFTYDAGQVGTMQEIRIIPKKQQGSNRIFCTESQIKFASTDITC